MIRSISVAILLLSLVPAFAADGSAKPNIVFVLIDDLRWDDLGCTGNPFVQTPNIDRVAREGCRFSNAFATSALCSPSRACILSGQYSHANGIIDNTERGKQSHGLKTFPQELQKAGYKTAFIGKWHMGNDSTRRPGFDRWFCLQGQGSTFDSVVNDDGKEQQTKGYVTDNINQQCVDFLRQSQDKPFLLYVSHKAIHPEVYQGPDGKLSDPTLSNFIPAPRHKDLYAGATIPRRPSAKVPPLDKPALQQKIANLPPLGPETGSSDKIILNRLRMLAAVDEGVGELLKTLENAGQLDNTLFVVTSDHGYFYGEHGLSVERRLAYEETIRIPLLMRLPSLIKAGTTIEPMVITLDFAPTFVQLAGGEIPSPYQGRSLLPLMEGKHPSDWRTSFLVEYYSDTVFPRMNKMGYKAVRGEQWKYIHFSELEGADELYDLHADPYELKNLIDDPNSKSALLEMRAELARLLAESTSN
jgi:arylsulfatase A-like enzyme